MKRMPRFNFLRPLSLIQFELVLFGRALSSAIEGSMGASISAGLLVVSAISLWHELSQKPPIGFIVVDNFVPPVALANF